MATKKENYQELLNILHTIDDAEYPELESFLCHEIELCSRPRKRTETEEDKRKKEVNSQYMNEIQAILSKSNRPMTIQEIQGQNTELATFTNQKVSSLMKGLVDAGIAIRIRDPKTKASVFSLA